MGLIGSILGYEHIWTIAFYAAVAILVAIFWRRFEIQGKFIALYKTKLGLELMDRLAKRYRELVKLFGLVGIGIGYSGMVFAVILILMMFYNWVIKPFALDGSPIILPGVPIAGTGGLVFPLVIGWISLFVIMVVHEFSHGVVARAYDVKVKSSGMVFIGPILGAFVEPDEKQIEKKGDIASYSIFGAGPFSNILLALFVFVLAIYIVGPITMAISAPAGVQVFPEAGLPADLAGVPDGAVIVSVDGASTLNTSDFIDAVAGIPANTTVMFVSTQNSYPIDSIEHPANSSRAYFGISVKDYREAKTPGLWGRASYASLQWIFKLFYWIIIISANVGIINLYPIFITDGARMLQVTMNKTFSDQKKAQLWWVRINKLCLLLMLLIVFVPLFRFIFM